MVCRNVMVGLQPADETIMANLQKITGLGRSAILRLALRHYSEHGPWSAQPQQALQATSSTRSSSARAKPKGRAV